MGVIKLLPEHIVSKIAAGEVIERPASVVKELIENSIDAGATFIKIEIEQGGKKLIRVYDNGCGIAPEDMQLLFTSHATSKLYSEEELFSISTLGFRGEALFSIGSVSSGQVESRPQGQDIGICIGVEAGKTSPLRYINCPYGTTVEIRNLFFNLPVRRKFLRADETEFSHIYQVVSRYSIGYPDVGFTLIHNHEHQLELEPVEDVKERIAHFLGKDISDALLDVKIEEPPFIIHALLSPAQYSRLSPDWQYFFINRRFIKDKIIARGLATAYQEIIPYGRYPIAFVFITIDPSEVDVNVHPTKIEVKFKNSYKLFQIISEKFREHLLSSHLPQTLASSQVEQAPQSKYQEVVDFFSKEMPSTPTQQEVFRQQSRYFVVKGLYIIEEVTDGIVIIDQHALHERVLYEQLKSQYNKSDLPKQGILLPQVVELTREEIITLEKNRQVINSIGFEYEQFGPQAVVIRAIPAIASDENPSTLLKDIIYLTEDEAEQGHHIIDRMLEFLACRCAVKAGDNLSDAEIERLLSFRDIVENPLSCAHGRPISVKITFQDIEKMLKRR